MYLLRAIRDDHLDQLYDLACKAQFGLTTLPKDRDILYKRIRLAVKSMNFESYKPAGELYFFVLENCVEKRIVGTSAIISKVGGFEPYYTYDMREKIYHSN